MSAHTPGPWTVDRIAVLDEFSKAVALAVPRSMEYCTYANARLIAAAPEILDCLRVLVKTMDDEVPGAHSWAAVIASRTAIAKATGATP